MQHFDCSVCGGGGVYVLNEHVLIMHWLHITMSYALGTKQCRVFSQLSHAVMSRVIKVLHERNTKSPQVFPLTWSPLSSDCNDLVTKIRHRVPDLVTLQGRCLTATCEFLY